MTGEELERETEKLDGKLAGAKKKLLKEERITYALIEFLWGATKILYFSIPVQIFLGLILALCGYWAGAVLIFGGPLFTVLVWPIVLFGATSKLENRVAEKWSKIDEQYDVEDGVLVGSRSREEQ